MAHASFPRFMLMAASALALGLAGCKSTPNPYETPPPARSLLQVTHHVGGTHYAMLVHDGTWYQTFSNSLLILDDRPMVRAESSNVIDTIELAEFGEQGPAVDLALLGNSLFVLLERDAVIELSLADPWSPREVRRLSASELGVRPMHLSVVDDQLLVSGQGGIVRMRRFANIPQEKKDEQKKKESPIPLGVERIVTGSDTFGPVAKSAQGLVTTVGRRILSVPGLQYLGSANEVISLPASMGGPDMVAYRWDGSDGAVVGLMGPDLRERDRMGFAGSVRAVEVIGEALWIVSDSAIVTCAIVDDKLQETRRIAVYGARDVAPLRDNYLAVAGTFGRSVYRIESDRSGPGDTFVGAHREPSALESSTYDGRFVLAGGREGYWLYELERGVTQAERGTIRAIDAQRSARTLKGNATLDETGTTLTVETGSASYTFAPDDGSRMHSVIAVDGDIWVSHDHGIIVLDGAATSPVIKDKKTIPGPVHTLYLMRVGGGAVYVSELGGFGVVRWILEPIPYEE